jgi:hypothetical protein
MCINGMAWVSCLDYAVMELLWAMHRIQCQWPVAHCICMLKNFLLPKLEGTNHPILNKYASFPSVPLKAFTILNNLFLKVSYSLCLWEFDAKISETRTALWNHQWSLSTQILAFFMADLSALSSPLHPGQWRLYVTQHAHITRGFIAIYWCRFPLFCMSF